MIPKPPGTPPDQRPVPGPLELRQGDFSDPATLALLKLHYDENRAVTPLGSAHVFDVQALNQPGVMFFTAHQAGELVGMGALRQFAPQTGEIKSMRVAANAQRQGIAQAILQHLLAQAKAQGLAMVYLETGSFEYFRPAIALYRKAGFTPCPPYGDYVADSNLLFMRKKL